jgi:hypothetical protein
MHPDDTRLWICPECNSKFFRDYGEGPCPHCKDPLTKAYGRANQQYRGLPHGWIQWKGTNVCMDVHCRCGAHMHIDDDFVYFIECPHCGAVYAVGNHVELILLHGKEVDEARKTPTLHLLEKSEDDF